MPELPEVETIRRSLEPLVKGAKITEIKVNTPVTQPQATLFCEQLTKKEILQIARRGKYLIFYLDDALVLVVHLRMTGQLVYYPKTAPPSKHTHVIFVFENGAELHFTDTRRFGRMWLVPKTELFGIPGLDTLGPEPIDEGFDKKIIADKLARHKKMKIKIFILDQTIIAGLGNIYADEVLFASGIHPERRCEDISQKELAALCCAMQNILKEAITHRGTSFRDYVDGNRAKGEHQDFLKVYQRRDQPCLTCGKPIKCIKVGGRSSFYCPHCQK